MKKIDTLTIVGVGLIGGSIAKAVKKKKLAKKIIGFGRRKSSLNKALKAKAIDEATVSFAKAVRNAEFVIIATPVSLIPPFLKKCQKYCKAGCIIIDVGSTKREIVRYAERTFDQNKFFIGTHPIAGSEKRGFEFSQPDLFDNSICFLVKPKRTTEKAFKRVKLFWKRLGAKLIVISSEKHDKIVAEISHLPHVVAFSLVNSCISSIKFAGNSFKDTTRVASSDVNIWLDIFFSNKINIIKSINKFIDNMNCIKAKIKSGRKNELRKVLAGAKLVREKLIRSDKKDSCCH